MRRLLISGSRRMEQAGLEYARTLVRHARNRGWEIFVGDNPRGVDAEVIRAAIEEGDDDHLVIYGAHRRCRIKDTGRAKVRLTDGNYTQRDRIMASRCDAVVGVWNGNSPGTQKAITSAAKMGKHAFLAGVSSLKTMARLRQIFPWCCFCNSVCQYLAQRHVRLRREGMRLVRETVTGNPSVVMSHSIDVYKQLLQELVDQHVERYGYGH